MTRLVRGGDGRQWTVRARMEWTNPATADDFEHDVLGGSAPGVVMAGICGLLLVALIWWTPSVVVVPAWLVLALFIVVMFFPVRWALRRPWTVVAETPGDLDEHPPERWVGQVRGVWRVRQEAARIARNIEVYAIPDRDGVGPLQPVE
ncbi:hypothetical protein GCM10012275_31020 [Longimycelium tulufanense]|uniref:DUF983 domain-containing protein n=1 Tax=Longimycelium tulufanense TaxID=907463 RepID=A0A8J3FUS8_9PSEU|nr:DUF983 domain-containing protein [Longimycelium tulufanense]GGM57623.1 hypothetical protein GCM10012275_31020 [Longimycelium tulufanense]